MKSVLISIQPKWCELIASSKKTIEVRKTRPKIDTPFKCYIYCTKAKQRFTHGGIVETLDDLFRMPNGQIKYGYSGELMCCDEPYSKDNFLNGKVIGEFVCDWVESTPLWRIKGNTGFCAKRTNREENLPKMACLSLEELEEYAGSESRLIYGWHISNLVIYDKPKELREFYTVCKLNCEYCEMWGSVRVNAEEFDMDCKSDWFNHKPLKRPPQSWCYVEEIKNA